jgi:hypothetical protein
VRRFIAAFVVLAVAGKANGNGNRGLVAFFVSGIALATRRVRLIAASQMRRLHRAKSI